MLTGFIFGSQGLYIYTLMLCVCLCKVRSLLSSGSLLQDYFLEHTVHSLHICCSTNLQQPAVWTFFWVVTQPQTLYSHNTITLRHWLSHNFWIPCTQSKTWHIKAPIYWLDEKAKPLGKAPTYAFQNTHVPGWEETLICIVVACWHLLLNSACGVMSVNVKLELSLLYGLVWHGPLPRQSPS